MGTTIIAEDAGYAEEPSKGVRVLGALLALQGLAAAGGLAWLVLGEGREPLSAVPLFLLVVAALSLAAAALDQMRQRAAEAVATAALLASFGLTLTLVLAGVWYLVPFVGLATIVAIFGLVDRFAVRDSAQHRSRH